MYRADPAGKRKKTSRPVGLLPAEKSCYHILGALRQIPLGESGC